MAKECGRTANEGALFPTRRTSARPARGPTDARTPPGRESHSPRLCEANREIGAHTRVNKPPALLNFQKGEGWTHTRLLFNTVDVAGAAASPACTSTRFTVAPASAAAFSIVAFDGQFSHRDEASHLAFRAPRRCQPNEKPGLPPLLRLLLGGCIARILRRRC